MPVSSQELYQHELLIAAGTCPVNHRSIRGPELRGESYAGIRIHFDGSTGWKLSSIELPAKPARALAATILIK